MFPMRLQTDLLSMYPELWTHCVFNKRHVSKLIHREKRNIYYQCSSCNCSALKGYRCDECDGFVCLLCDHKLRNDVPLSTPSRREFVGKYVAPDRIAMTPNRYKAVRAVNKMNDDALTGVLDGVINEFGRRYILNCIAKSANPKMLNQLNSLIDEQYDPVPTNGFDSLPDTIIDYLLYFITTDELHRVRLISSRFATFICSGRHEKKMESVEILNTVVWNHSTTLPLPFDPETEIQSVLNDRQNDNIRTFATTEIQRVNGDQRDYVYLSRCGEVHEIPQIHRIRLDRSAQPYTLVHRDNILRLSPNDDTHPRAHMLFYHDIDYNQVFPVNCVVYSGSLSSNPFRSYLLEGGAIRHKGTDWYARFMGHIKAGRDVRVFSCCPGNRWLERRIPYVPYHPFVVFTCSGHSNSAMLEFSRYFLEFGPVHLTIDIPHHRELRKSIPRNGSAYDSIQGHFPLQIRFHQENGDMIQETKEKLANRFGIDDDECIELVSDGYKKHPVIQIPNCTIRCYFVLTHPSVRNKGGNLIIIRFFRGVTGPYLTDYEPDYLVTMRIPFTATNNNLRQIIRETLTTADRNGHFLMNDGLRSLITQDEHWLVSDPNSPGDDTDDDKGKIKIEDDDHGDGNNETIFVQWMDRINIYVCPRQRRTMNTLLVRFCWRDGSFCGIPMVIEPSVGATMKEIVENQLVMWQSFVSGCVFCKGDGTPKIRGPKRGSNRRKIQKIPKIQPSDFHTNFPSYESGGIVNVMVRRYSPGDRTLYSVEFNQREYNQQNYFK